MLAIQKKRESTPPSLSFYPSRSFALNRFLRREHNVEWERIIPLSSAHFCKFRDGKTVSAYGITAVAARQSKATPKNNNSIASFKVFFPWKRMQINWICVYLNLFIALLALLAVCPQSAFFFSFFCVLTFPFFRKNCWMLLVPFKWLRHYGKWNLNRAI